MFRRPFVRPLRRALRGDVPPLLRRANELMAAGNYPAAAEAYEQLARGAKARGIMAGQIPAGMTNLKQGLTIISNRGNFQHLERVGLRAIADLNQRGLTVEAGEIEALLKGKLPDSFAAEVSSSPVKQRLLPTSCPGCGGPLRSDEVEWVDEATAECPFCGGAVREE
jgi:hypothetical protein